MAQPGDDKEMTAAVTAEASGPKFRVPRLPGDIMIYPMIVGLILNTFCPRVFEIGGFFTAATRGGSNAVVAAILLFVGAGISFKSTPGAIKTGIVILIPKLVLAAALGLGIAYFFNDNFLGLSSVSVIGGISFCNMALYTGIMGEFGDESERGASMSLSSFISGGISGVLLGLITLLVVGPVTFAFERLCGGSGKAAIARSTVAGTAMTTPVALAEVAPRYAELAPTAYAQIATAVIITAILAPILTGWVDKKFCQGGEDLSAAGVEVLEEAVAKDVDGE